MSTTATTTAAVVTTLAISMFERIESSKQLVTKALIGTTIKVRLSNQPIQEIPVKDKDGNAVFSKSTGFQLFKKILNTKAASEQAVNHGFSKKFNMSTPQLLDECIAELDAPGFNPETMTDKMNEYLNRTSFSFSLLSTDKMFDSIQPGEELSGVVSEIVTENGSVLTLSANTIRVVAPVALEKGTSKLAARRAAMSVAHPAAPVTADAATAAESAAATATVPAKATA